MGAILSPFLRIIRVNSHVREVPGDRAERVGTTLLARALDLLCADDVVLAPSHSSA